MLNPSPLEELLSAIHPEMNRCARLLRLCLDSPRNLSSGSHLSYGAGQSLEYHDHRSYLPGDDPRHIDWKAFARTDSYSIKLYRNEAAPRVDLVVDFSRSMLFADARRRRMLELLYFVFESCNHHRVSLAVTVVAGAKLERLDLAALRSYTFNGVVTEQLHAADKPADVSGTADLTLVPWRTGALRVFVSDLLYPAEPDSVLRQLSVAQSRSVIFAPYLPEEVNPSWDGAIEFLDCESEQRRRELIDPAVLAQYSESYNNHFSRWREAAVRHGLTLSRVDCGENFLPSLEAEALPMRALELCS